MAALENIGWGLNKKFDYDQLATSGLGPRIHNEVPVGELVGQVFSGKPAEAFAQCLQGLAGEGAKVEIGGRQVRFRLGCATKDIAVHVRSDAWYLFPHAQVRLGLLMHILGQYPEERAARPDLDVFVEGVGVAEVKDRLAEKGVVATVVKATGNVDVLAVEGQKGVATVVRAEDSWQTGAPWPMYAARGVVDEKGTMVVDIAHERLHAYPLDLPAVWSFGADEPRRMAAVGRALLWCEYEADPNGSPLKLPPEVIWPSIIETVEQVYPMAKKIRNGQVDPKLYTSSMRDFALAFMQMVQRRFGGISDGRRLFEQVGAAFLGSR